MRASASRIAAAAPGGPAFWGLLALVALAPLPFGSNRPWSWSLVSALAGLLLLVWAYDAWRDPGAVAIAWRRHGFLTLPYLAVILWALVQAVPWTPEAWHHPLWRAAGEALDRPLTGAIALDPDAAVEGAMRLLGYGAVFFLAVQLGRDPGRARLVLWTVALAGLAYAVYGLAIALGGYDMVLWFPKWVYRDSLTGTFVNRTAFAIHAGLALLATLALLRETTRASAEVEGRAGFAGFLETLPPAAFLLIAAAAALASAMVLSNSRGALAATGAGIAALAFALALRRGGARGGAALVVAALLGGLAIVAVSGGVFVERLLEGAGGPTGRESIHALTLRTIGDRPLLGHGLGGFASLFRLYRDDSFRWVEPPYYDAHGTYLELAAELGLPAAAVLIAAAGSVALLCLIGAARRRRARIYPCLGFAAAALVGLHTLFDFAVETPAVAVTFLALAGVGYAQSFRTVDDPVPPRA